MRFLTLTEVNGGSTFFSWRTSQHPCISHSGEKMTHGLSSTITKVMNGTKPAAAQEQVWRFMEVKSVAQWLKSGRHRECDSRMRHAGGKVHIDQHTELLRNVTCYPSNVYPPHSALGTCGLRRMLPLPPDMINVPRLRALFEILGAPGTDGIATIMLLRNNSLDHWLSLMSGLSTFYSQGTPCTPGLIRNCNASNFHGRARVEGRMLRNLLGFIGEHEEIHRRLRALSLHFARRHQVPLLILRYEDVVRRPELWYSHILPFLNLSHIVLGPDGVSKRNPNSHRESLENFAHVAAALRGAGMARYLRDEPNIREAAEVEVSGVVRMGAGAVHTREMPRALS